MDLEHLAGTFQSANWTTEFADTLITKAPSQLAYADCDFLVRRVRAQIAKGRVGRARNWVALGLYLDSASVAAHFKRVGLFRASKLGFNGESLRRLIEIILEAGDRLLDSIPRRADTWSPSGHCWPWQPARDGSMFLSCVN